MKEGQHFNSYMTLSMYFFYLYIDSKLHLGRQKELSCHGHPSDFFLHALATFTITRRREMQEKFSRQG